MANLDTAYLITHVNVATAAELGALPTNGLADGCIATVTGLFTTPTVSTSDQPFFALVKAATNTAVTNKIVNSADSDGGTLPGRWVNLSTVPDLT